MGLPELAAREQAPELGDGVVAPVLGNEVEAEATDQDLWIDAEDFGRAAVHEEDPRVLVDLGDQLLHLREDQLDAVALVASRANCLVVRTLGLGSALPELQQTRGHLYREERKREGELQPPGRDVVARLPVEIRVGELDAEIADDEDHDRHAERHRFGRAIHDDRGCEQERRRDRGAVDRIEHLQTGHRRLPEVVDRCARRTREQPDQDRPLMPRLTIRERERAREEQRGHPGLADVGRITRRREEPGRDDQERSTDE